MSLKEYNQLKEVFSKASIASDIEGILHWDMSTMMPHNSRNQRAEQLAYLSKIIHDKISSNEVRDLRSAAILAGAGRRVNPGFFDSRNVISPAELAAAKAIAKERNKRLARAALRKRDGGNLGFITSGV